MFSKIWFCKIGNGKIFLIKHVGPIQQNINNTTFKIYIYFNLIIIMSKRNISKKNTKTVFNKKIVLKKRFNSKAEQIK